MKFSSIKFGNNIIFILSFFIILTSCAKRLNDKTSANKVSKSDIFSYKILLPIDYTDAEKITADILQSEINKIHGISLNIQTRYSNDNKYISVGNTYLWNEYQQIKKNEIEFEDEQSIVVSFNGHVLLNGSEKRGKFYAACSFLEEEMDIHYLGQNVWVGNRDLKSIAIKDRVFKPKFSNRSVFYSNSLDPYFSSRNRINLWYDKNITFSEIGGNDVGGPSGTHTYDQLVPKEKYYFNHPEFYSDQFNTKRDIKDCTQLCLTNDQVFKIAKENILIYLKNNKDTDYINIAANDCNNTCSCDKCNKINLEESSNFGTLARFLNKMSDELIPLYPKIKLITLSYLDLYKAPVKTKLKNNITVRISTDTTSWNRPFKKIRDDNNFKNRVDNWKKVCKNLWVYDYGCNFGEYFMIHPSIYNIADNLKFYSELGFSGVTIESFYENSGVEESELRVYLYSKLLVNPENKIDSIINQFCNKYYGIEAGKLLKQYYDIIYHKKDLYKYNTETIKYLFNTNDINQIINILNNLSKINVSNEVKHRIQRWELSIKYTLVKEYNHLLLNNIYKEYFKDIKNIIDNNNYTKLGSFNNDIKGFLRVHENRSSKRVYNSNASLTDKIVLDGSQLIVYNPTNDTLTFPSIIFDDKAINGISVKMPAKYQDWLVRFEPDEVFATQYDNYKLSIRIRGESKNYNKNEMAFGVGVYDRKTNIRPLDRYFYLSDLKNDFRIIELGKINLTSNTVIYIFPVMNENLNAIYLDNFSFTKQ